jgi:nitrate reductase NapAB chaperone NapD
MVRMIVVIQSESQGRGVSDMKKGDKMESCLGASLLIEKEARAFGGSVIALTDRRMR